ncbi:MAG: rhomboid family intramembrane serine protease [Christensenellaceae bacterium]|jgi:GlpG protein|nr:rhomboid family intramembrane serine protease [Christensenellaceae bacterium]
MRILGSKANWFFIGTILVIVVNILLFAVLGGSWAYRVRGDGSWHWESVLYFDPMIRSFLKSFTHFNWQHVLLNMLCFVVCGFYLERKIGSVKFVLLVLVMAFFTSMTVSTNNASAGWQGFSGVNYGLYAYIIVDFLFSIKSSGKFNMLFGGVVLGLIYFAMCFNGGTESFGFEFYPYDLFNNLGHYSSAVAGLVLGLTIQIVKIQNNNRV